MLVTTRRRPTGWVSRLRWRKPETSSERARRAFDAELRAARDAHRKRVEDARAAAARDVAQAAERQLADLEATLRAEAERNASEAERERKREVEARIAETEARSDWDARARAAALAAAFDDRAFALSAHAGAIKAQAARLELQRTRDVGEQKRLCEAAREDLKLAEQRCERLEASNGRRDEAQARALEGLEASLKASRDAERARAMRPRPSRRRN